MPMGREFSRVIIILRDDWLGMDEDRCLLYVGMTRARDELVILAEDDHDALEEIALPVTDVIPLPASTEGPLFYQVTCEPTDIHLGHEATLREQERIELLREGDPLRIIPGPKGTWLITTSDGVPIGALSSAQTSELRMHRITPHTFQFAEGEVTVHQIRRCHVNKGTRWVVLPAIHVKRSGEIDTTDYANEMIHVYL
jgi:hypothetical protein